MVDKSAIIRLIKLGSKFFLGYRYNGWVLHNCDNSKGSLLDIRFDSLGGPDIETIT